MSVVGYIDATFHHCVVTRTKFFVGVLNVLPFKTISNWNPLPVFEWNNGCH